MLRRSDTLLGEVGTNSGMKMKLQVVLINNALLLFKFVDTVRGLLLFLCGGGAYKTIDAITIRQAYVPPPGESPPTELHLKIPLSTANLSFEKSQNGITVRVQRQVCRVQTRSCAWLARGEYVLILCCVVGTGSRTLVHATGRTRGVDYYSQ